MLYIQVLLPFLSHPLPSESSLNGRGEGPTGKELEYPIRVSFGMWSIHAKP